jgi:hypothetical protein
MIRNDISSAKFYELIGGTDASIHGIEIGKLFKNLYSDCLSGSWSDKLSSRASDYRKRVSSGK